jgi:cobalt-precorrin 5A hydrolase/precorrin-3B C17-methyltransferase
MRIAVFCVTDGGKRLAKRLSRALKEHNVKIFSKPFSLKDKVSYAFKNFDALIFIMALGIVVRLIAGQLKGKAEDPPIVVLDESGRFAVSVLSGHKGANDLARIISNRIGAVPVITTATEILGLPSVEEIAKELDLLIDDYEKAKKVNAAIVNGGRVGVVSDIPLNIRLPENMPLVRLDQVGEGFDALIVVTNREIEVNIPCVFLRPKNLIVGVGAKEGVSKEKVLEGIEHVFREERLSLKSLKAISTPEFKAREPGIIAVCRELDVPLIGIPVEDIKRIEDRFDGSDFVQEKVGVRAVSEPCAILGGRSAKLIRKKTKVDGVTVAIAEEDQNSGKISLVGLGPGTKDYMSFEAFKALMEADVVIGYRTYLDLIRDIIAGKEVISKGMRQEMERAKLAVEKAREGKRVVVVSSGDPGVYGMGSVIFEYLRREKIDVPIEVVPGITAATAAAACLGSPLGHDFAAVSLSDILTPWRIIRKRIEDAARGDFVIVLYNPKSKRRSWQIREAVAIIRKYRSKDTPVGLVRNAMRPGEEVIVTTLERMLDYPIDMSTTVIVGNSETFTYNGRMVTPRGYKA